MILLDANLLVYANDADSPHHEVARVWFEGALNESTKVGFPWPTLLAFVRLMGSPHVSRRPVPLAKTWRRAQEWLSLPNAWIPLPTDRHREILATLLAGESRPNLVNDAHLGALAIEHGLTVCSSDRDFARFHRVRWTNPIDQG